MTQAQWAGLTLLRHVEASGVQFLGGVDFAGTEVIIRACLGGWRRASVALRFEK